MIDAIVYTSNTGSAASYADLLSKDTFLPAYSLKEALNVLPRKSKIIYIGWTAASKVKGYKKAKKRYQIEAICAVGLGQNGSQIEIIRKKSSIPSFIPLFTMQGNFNVKKLHGLYRLLMKIVVRISSKCLLAKKDRTIEEDDMLAMMLHGGERVKKENLAKMLNWYRNNSKE